ncbi:MAG: RsmE family RNA methyltransferase [Candidatus Electrothrix sp. ATG2]|nr:RsmE family RNA methyltransferase [Candidatus Electrothrix sp. ATG2]
MRAKEGIGGHTLTTGRIFPVYSTLVGSISYHLGNWGHNLTELNNAQPILVLIGPEGGFHPDEVAYAEEIGFRTISLGPRILQAETAALVAVVLAQQKVGNLLLGKRKSA